MQGAGADAWTHAPTDERTQTTTHERKAPEQARGECTNAKNDEGGRDGSEATEREG